MPKIIPKTTSISPEVTPISSKTTSISPEITPISPKNQAQNTDSNVFKKSDSDRVPTVTATVGTRLKEKVEFKANQFKKPEKAILKAINFDELYKYIKQQLLEKKISLSIRNMRKSAHKYLKRNPSLANLSISITNTNYLVNKVRDKMLKAQFIIENPNYSKGKSKYLFNKTKSKVHLT